MGDSLTDMFYLLKLEAVKRAKDEEEYIYKMIADKHEEYLEAENVYLEVFSAFVNIVTQGFTRSLIASKETACSEQLSETAALAELSCSITKEINKKTAAALLNIDYIHPNHVERIHKLLEAATENPNIEQHYAYILSSRNLKNDIKRTLGRIEVKLENAINVGLDSMISKFEIE